MAGDTYDRYEFTVVRGPETEACLADVRARLGREAIVLEGPEIVTDITEPSITRVSMHDFASRSDGVHTPQVADTTWSGLARLFYNTHLQRARQQPYSRMLMQHLRYGQYPWQFITRFEFPIHDRRLHISKIDNLQLIGLQRLVEYTGRQSGGFSGASAYQEERAIHVVFGNGFGPIKFSFMKAILKDRLGWIDPADSSQ